MKEAVLQTLNEWNPEIQMTVKVRFIKRGNDKALTAGDYTVRLYDRDVFDDDYLGKSRLDENGEAHIHFYPSDFQSADSPLEELPDLYVLLFDGDTVHFQSKVWENVDFEHEAVLNFKEGEVLDFGTFLVD
jgi:hypothetical protein